MLENVKFEVKLDLNEGATQLANTPLGFAMTTGCKVLVAPVLEQCVYGVQRYENAKRFLEELIEPRIQNIPEEYRQLPQKRVLLHTLKGVTDLEENETTLQEMFANLLAGSMDNRKSDDIHPSYAKLISELSEDDAKFLSWLFNEVDTQRIPRLQVTLRTLTGREMYNVTSYPKPEPSAFVIDYLTTKGLLQYLSLAVQDNDFPSFFEKQKKLAFDRADEATEHIGISFDSFVIIFTQLGQHFMEAVTLKESPTDEKS